MDEKFMKFAIAEAIESMEENNPPFGCCIVNNITGNYVSSHNTTVSKKNFLNHAEINAIRLYQTQYNEEELKDCTIYTTTFPCLMCFGAITWSGISEVVYGASLLEAMSNGFNEVFYSRDRLIIPHKIQVYKSEYASECVDILLKWKKRNRLIELIKRGK